MASLKTATFYLRWPFGRKRIFCGFFRQLNRLRQGVAHDLPPPLTHTGAINGPAAQGLAYDGRLLRTASPQEDSCH
ncbi:hypothetical protein CJF34_20055 [Pseudomonas lundensis]|nr:hypothetical protein TU74_02915 [Pseudomonas lundensis]OZY48863.1 hypothetical protein CJF34_20055 [Pseudomonas lundensis]